MKLIRTMPNAEIYYRMTKKDYVVKTRDTTEYFDTLESALAYLEDSTTDLLIENDQDRIILKPRGGLF